MDKNTRLDLYRSEIEDPYIRENFIRTQNFLRDQPLLKGHFTFKQYAIQAATNNFRVLHKLSFTPLDAIVSYQSDPTVTVTLNQNLWDAQFIDITTTGPVTIRMFLGRFEDTNS